MLLRLLRRHLRPYRGLLAFVLVLQAVQALAALYLPSLNAHIIDDGIATGDTGLIWRLGGIMILVALLQVLFASAAMFYASRTAMSFGRDVRDALFDRVTGFSAREVAQLGAPSLITRITNDVQQVQLFVVMTCTFLVAAPITAAGGILLALQQDGVLSIVLAVSVPALLTGVGLVVVRMVPQFQAMQERIDRVNQVLREQITGIRVVRAFVREPDEVARFAGANAALTETSLKAGRLMAFMFPIVMIVMNVSSVAALWVGGNRLDAGQMQIGALIAFLTYLVQILIAVMMATFVAVLAPRASVCAERIEEVLHTESSVAAPTDPVTELATRGHLELRDVGFAYPGAERPVLGGVSFTARPGQTTAVIGSTGAGKTTLVNLIPRLFDATEGAVLVDGVDVRDLRLRELRRSVGIVFEDTFLFSDTIAANIAFAEPDVPHAAIERAARLAGAHDFVSALEDGYGTRIGERGYSLSGGQRQRIAIARAILADPRILVLDDATSAVDPTKEHEIRDALATVMSGRTTIVIAHRPATIALADRVVLLDGGRVVAEGTHDGLLATEPRYRAVLAAAAADEAPPDASTLRPQEGAEDQADGGSVAEADGAEVDGAGAGAGADGGSVHVG